MRRILCIVTLIALTSTPVAAQGTAQTFKLRWFGQSFFQLETPNGRNIVFDPHLIPEFERPQVKADIVLCTHLHDDHAQVEAVADPKSARVFHGVEEVKKGKPPEWKKIDEKVGQIKIRTVGLYHDTMEGLERGKISAFIVECDGLTFCHLGDVGHELSDLQAKAIGPVDVLMIPVGGIYTINGEQAKAVVAKLKPRLFIVPMHYAAAGLDLLQPPDEFLDGQKNLKKTPETNELVIPTDAKADAPTVLVPGWKKKA